MSISQAYFCNIAFSKLIKEYSNTQKFSQSTVKINKKKEKRKAIFNRTRIEKGIRIIMNVQKINKLNEASIYNN